MPVSDHLPDKTSYGYNHCRKALIWTNDQDYVSPVDRMLTPHVTISASLVCFSLFQPTDDKYASFLCGISIVRSRMDIWICKTMHKIVVLRRDTRNR